MALPTDGRTALPDFDDPIPPLVAPMQTLLLLLKHAETDRDAALAASDLATRAERATHAQLIQLEGYRRDYETRWGAHFSQGGEIALVRCYHDFMGRLNQAVEKQQQATFLAIGNKDAALQTLRERELRVASVGKLIERRTREMRVSFERRDQKQFDEMSARIVRMTPLGGQLGGQIGGASGASAGAADFVATR